MPGLSVSRCLPQSSTRWSSSSGSGRGPTRLISPLSTLRSCGSSSIESRRSVCPKLVTRGSFGILSIRASPFVTCMLRWATSSRRVSASATIVRNLNIRKGLSPQPMRSWRKKTGPAESSLILIAMNAKTGASRSSATADRTRSSVRLRSLDECESFSCGRLIIGSPSTVWISTPRADELEEPRDDVDLHGQALERADQAQKILVRLVGERDHDPLHVVGADDVRELLRGAEKRQMLEIRARRLRRGVHESDEVDAVLRVLQELAGDELADVSGPDDDRVLEIARSSGGTPREPSRGRR